MKGREYIPLGSSSPGDDTSVFFLTQTGPSPLSLHWRRRFRLQVNEEWPLIDHVWSCTTLSISACSSLVCLRCPTVLIITPFISCASCVPYNIYKATCFYFTIRYFLFLTKCLFLWLLFESDVFFSLCRLSFPPLLSLAAVLALILQHQQVL